MLFAFSEEGAYSYPGESFISAGPGTVTEKGEIFVKCSGSCFRSLTLPISHYLGIFWLSFPKFLTFNNFSYSFL